MKRLTSSEVTQPFKAYSIKDARSCRVIGRAPLGVVIGPPMGVEDIRGRPVFKLTHDRTLRSERSISRGRASPRMRGVAARAIRRGVR
jgi:hypothetical protein